MEAGAAFPHHEDVRRWKPARAAVALGSDGVGTGWKREYYGSWWWRRCVRGEKLESTDPVEGWKGIEARAVLLLMGIA
jgi:hypothetical protein